MNNTICLTIAAVIFYLGTSSAQHETGWDISIIPSSIRIDPVTSEVIDIPDYPSKTKSSESTDIIDENWVFDGNQADLYGARGEYISFQLMLSNSTDRDLTDIQVTMNNFQNEENQIEISPELFLEWSVEVKTKSTGYSNSSLGKRWYPDALIPFKYIQLDSSLVHRWTYPLWLPDFNNRVDDQQSMLIWVDQYIPIAEGSVPPGEYHSEISVSIGKVKKSIPIKLTVWGFEIPNENTFGASLQHEGFVSGKSEAEALGIYQLMKRNRISVMEPTYQPELTITGDRKININWKDFDNRLEKYFTGKAFTNEYGYDFGPGYGEPIENFVLPFDVYGKYSTSGWPDIGDATVERDPKNISLYIDAIKKVRNHLSEMVDPEKTDLTIYLNGLDESYFRKAWERMVYFGDIFKKYYPEAHFRIDGAYSREAMDFVKNSIDYWATHTINFDHKDNKMYHDMGINSWLYGPMLYESAVNSWVGSSTFIDLPLVNDRAISWACWKYNIYSWISWGIGAGWKHAWYDPETWKDAYKLNAGSDPDFKYKKQNGNGMLIYSGGIVPNVDGPCPSIRLKTMRDGVQEYEYLRLLTKIDGNDKRAREIVDGIINQPFGEASIGVIDVWRFDAQKWDEARIKMGKMINEKASNH